MKNLTACTSFIPPPPSHPLLPHIPLSLLKNMALIYKSPPPHKSDKIRHVQGYMLKARRSPTKGEIAKTLTTKGNCPP